MSEPTTIARPYAKAAFEIASKHNTAAVWSKAFAAIKACLTDDAVQRVVGNPLLPARNIAQFVIGKVGSLDDQVQNFVSLLAENQRLMLIPYITALFEEYRAESEQSIEAQVIAAMPLDEAQQKSLTETLSRRLNAKVVLNCSLDKSLLAGAIIHAGSLSIDGSLKSRLQKLSETLNA